MRVICLVKFIPDVDSFQYDCEKNILVRENVNMILNPDDACALAYALKLKKESGSVVEVVSMAPYSTLDLVRDLLRRGADSASLLSDKLFAGSDTYATSMVLGQYLRKVDYGLILTGTRSIDGDTSHIPPQIAELLGLPHMSGIRRIDHNTDAQDAFVCEVEVDSVVYRFSIKTPAVLGISKESGYKLPFVRYTDLDIDVDERIQILTNQDIGCAEDTIGLSGSLTRVLSTRLPEVAKREKTVVETVDDGVEIVYHYLKNKGFVV